MQLTLKQAADRLGKEAGLLVASGTQGNLVAQVLDKLDVNRGVLVGHSLGGNAVTTILQKLATEGITIDYAAVIDAPNPKPVAPAVVIVDNFYQFEGARKPVLVAQNPRKTRINQYNFRGRRGQDGGEGTMKPKRGHLSIATDSFVTHRIMTMVDRLGR